MSWRTLRVRVAQLAQTLRGDQFWYLGGTYGNACALAGGLEHRWRVCGALPRCTCPPVALVGAAMLASVFTISDLFVTHYALIYPFVVSVGYCTGPAVGTLLPSEERNNRRLR